MKTTGFKTMIVIVLAATVLAGQAIAGPGGSSRGRGGRQGWGRGMAGGPRMGANLESVQPDDYWRPGPYCPFSQGPNQNIQGRQGRGLGEFSQGFQGPRGPYCPYCQRPNQNIRGWQGRGGQSRGPAMQGRGGRGGRGPAMLGRGGRGFQRRNIAPQDWGMNRRGGQFRPEGMGRPGPGMQPRQFEPGDTGRPMPPRGRGWAPGSGPGRRQGMGPGWGQGPQPEKAPDTNAPAEPVVKDQTEKPQSE